MPVVNVQETLQTSMHGIGSCVILFIKAKFCTETYALEKTIPIECKNSFFIRSRPSDNCVNAEDNPRPTKKRKLCDLFNTMLLDELVIEIFSYFDYQDLLMAAALVCKRWESLSKAPELWRHLNLCNISELTAETVEMLLERSNGIKYLNFNNQCSLVWDSVISKIAEQKKLQELHLQSCSLLSPRLLYSIANCRSLQKLNLGRLPLTDDALRLIAESCTNLKELIIYRCLHVTTDGLLPVIQHCTQMKILRMVGCKRVNDDFLIALAAKPSQIDHLDIRECNFTADGLIYIRKLPKLLVIDASGVRSMCDDLVSIFSNLIRLYLAKIEDITNDGISTIVSKNPNLTSLCLGSESVDDIGLEIISRSPCRLTLEGLFIADCQISEYGVNHILQNCTKLRSLGYSRIPEETVNKWQTKYQHIRFRNLGA